MYAHDSSNMNEKHQKLLAIKLVQFGYYLSKGKLGKAVFNLSSGLIQRILPPSCIFGRSCIECLLGCPVHHARRYDRLAKGDNANSFRSVFSPSVLLCFVAASIKLKLPLRKYLLSNGNPSNRRGNESHQRSDNRTQKTEPLFRRRSMPCLPDRTYNACPGGESKREADRRNGEQSSKSIKIHADKLPRASSFVERVAA